MPRPIDPMALRQLRAWQEIAEMWPLTIDHVGRHIRCGECELSVICLADASGEPFDYSADELQALTVAHLRNHHPDLDPCKDIV